MPNKLYYLAHPYTNPDPETNVRACVDIANDLIDDGYSVYAPIVMTHWLDVMVPRDHDFWLEYDETMMERCDGIILAGDWRSSKGCRHEYQYFIDHAKQVLVRSADGDLHDVTKKLQV
jgi:hypothetical protein